MTTVIETTAKALSSLSQPGLQAVCRLLPEETLKGLLVAAAQANASEGFDGGIPSKEANTSWLEAALERRAKR